MGAFLLRDNVAGADSAFSEKNAAAGAFRVSEVHLLAAWMMVLVHSFQERSFCRKTEIFPDGWGADVSLGVAGTKIRGNVVLPRVVGVQHQAKDPSPL